MDLDAWHDLFVAAAGAGSALAGLIIVAMSVNITTILAIPGMTSRAATTIGVLVLVVVITCAGLVPGQGPRALGADLEAGLYLAAAAIITAFATAVANAWVLLVEILR